MTGSRMGGVRTPCKKKEGELKVNKESFELHTPGLCNERARSLSVSDT